jgi:hypothetical protein
MLAMPAAAADHDCAVPAADDARSRGNDLRTETPHADVPASPDSGDPEAIRRRQLAVNLFLCANGLPGCDVSLLSPEERERFIANRPPPP